MLLFFSKQYSNSSDKDNITGNGKQVETEHETSESKNETVPEIKKRRKNKKQERNNR